MYCTTVHKHSSNREFCNKIYLFIFRALESVFNAMSNALLVTSFCLGGGKGFLT